MRLGSLLGKVSCGPPCWSVLWQKSFNCQKRGHHGIMEALAVEEASDAKQNATTPQLSAVAAARIRCRTGVAAGAAPVTPSPAASSPAASTPLRTRTAATLPSAAGQEPV